MVEPRVEPKVEPRVLRNGEKDPKDESRPDREVANCCISRWRVSLMNLCHAWNIFRRKPSFLAWAWSLIRENNNNNKQNAKKTATFYPQSITFLTLPTPPRGISWPTRPRPFSWCCSCRSCQQFVVVSSDTPSDGQQTSAKIWKTTWPAANYEPTNNTKERYNDVSSNATNLSMVTRLLVFLVLGVTIFFKKNVWFDLNERSKKSTIVTVWLLRKWIELAHGLKTENRK